VCYTDGYPDKLPDLSLKAIEGELEDDELDSLLRELRTIVCIFQCDSIFDSKFHCDLRVRKI
jgi:hypothetical protein